LLLLVVAPFQGRGEIHYAGTVVREEVAVYFQGSLEKAAVHVADLYPDVKVELESQIGWKVASVPSVVLLKNQDDFQRMSGNTAVVAFAVPTKDLIMINYPRMKDHPFSVKATLKHELCHLLLHQYIRNDRLPKWLDEGIAQWVSEGMVEIVAYEKRTQLDKAVLTGRCLPLQYLSDGFPDNKREMLLAYEESRSFVEYIVEAYGEELLRDTLRDMAVGRSVNESIMRRLSMSIGELEQQWIHHLRRRVNWFTSVSRNLYEILFFLAGLMTVIGFVRVFIKKKRYKDDGDDDEVARKSGT
ncbi:MAG: hypothetical protein JXD19_06245, partial [Deltaproteobacteria bacterium]|nr:hypothetical protein [Deltaproteobacteria bacterium]